MIRSTPMRPMSSRVFCSLLAIIMASQGPMTSILWIQVGVAQTETASSPVADDEEVADAREQGSGADNALPVLRLRPDGTRTVVSQLRFSRDGRTIFAAGDNKRVDAWTRQDDGYVRDHDSTLRSPLGPGPKGILRALDGTTNDRFIAVGGIGSLPSGDDADFRTDGLMIPASGLGRRMLEHLGTVTLFDRIEGTRRGLKSHLGYIISIDVMDVGDGRPPWLVVLGNDEVPMQCEGGPDDSRPDSVGRSLRVIDGGSGQVRRQWTMPVSGLLPQVSAWLDVPGDIQSLRAVVNDADGQSGGLKVVSMTSEQPRHVPSPLAIAQGVIKRAESAGQREIVVPDRRGVLFIDPEDGSTAGKLDLTASLSASEFIYRIAVPSETSDVLALTIRDLAQPQQGHQLLLVDVSDGKAIGPKVTLGNRQNPALAISPDGRTIAATADVMKGLQIFSVTDIRGGSAKPTQSIRPDFIPVMRAALAQDDAGKQGLRLELNSGDQLQRWDLIDGGFSRDDDKTSWQSFGTPVTFSPPDESFQVKPSVVVDGQSLTLPNLPTMLPAVGTAMQIPGLNRSIAAIGYVSSTGEATSRLILVDGSTGAIVRQLSGHDQIIVSAEFSKLGDRLTTVSSDGVVCVWSLDDLDDLIGQRGTMTGITFCHDGTDLIVTQRDTGGTEAGNELQVGDRLLGIPASDVDNGELETFATVARFLRALSLRPVGTRVPLRVRRGGRDLDVTIPLTQATDERKPLFSLILTREVADGPLSWLAWSPHGPFDASDESIQRRAGWHFNDTTDAGPIRFGTLGEYRNQFFGRGLIDALLVQGRVPAVWPPAVEPALSGTISDLKGVEHYAKGRSFTLPEGSLDSLRFLVDDVPAASVTSVTATTTLGDLWKLKRLPSDPSIWEANARKQFAPGTRTYVQVEVTGDRIVSGLYQEIWQIDVPAMQDPLEIPKPNNGEVASQDDPSDGNVGKTPAMRPGTDPKPMPPELRWVSHDTRNVLPTPSGWDGDLTLTLTGRVNSETVDQDCQYFADVDGKLQRLDEFRTRGALFKGNIELPIGRHLVSLVSKMGTVERRSETISMDRLDPPEITRLEATVGNNDTATATAIVRCARPPQEEHVRVMVEGIGFDHMPVMIEPIADRTNRYRVRVTEIPLSAGDNQISCQLIDSTGASRSPATAEIQHTPTIRPPRLMVQLNPATAVNRDAIDFSVRVVSSEPVSIRLTVDNQVLPIGRLRAMSNNTYVADAFVPLEFGTNRIVLTAIDSGGRSSQSIHDISRIQPPIRIRVDEIRDARGNVFSVRQSGKEFSAEGVTGTAQVMIRGRVQLGGSPDERPASIRGWVNGFLQSVSPLESRATNALIGVASNELPFQIPLTLTAVNSVVRFDLPELPESEDSVTRMRIGCVNPSDDQTLHLMVINTDLSMKDRIDFESEVLQAFQVQNGAAPAFAKVIAGGAIYPTLTGEVRSGSIKQLIRKCKLQTRSGNGRSDVVMFYFQGEEIRGDGGQFGLVTYDVIDRLLDDPAIVSSDYLGEQFADIRGAHLMFLDVQPHPDSLPTPTAGDPRHPTLGVMRLSRTDEQDGTLPSTAEQTPVDPPMLIQIREYLPQVERLIDLARRMRVNQPADSLVFQDAIPPDLSELRIGDPR
ncbi:MAG: WD40 repeat domain-containing protein [Planctomycetota bacterium]